jgi:quinolinate synthase
VSIQQEIRELKRERNAIILAHTYQPAEVQDIADFVGDSYGLSVEAAAARADVIVFCGVMFMAETAALLNPSRTVIIPEPSAGCPMADMIEPEDLVALKAKHPGHVVMCYVNSTAAIKALSDICCTSANALAIARQIPAERGIIFVPDEHLGDYVAEETGRDIVLWKGFCPTHLRITEEMLRQARMEHPKAAILIHPEATRVCRHLADQVLSTGGMCRFVKADTTHQEYVIATEVGIIHTLEKQNPQKRFIALSDRISCPNMKKGSLLSVKEALEGRRGMVVKVPEEVAAKARRCLEKMLEMSKGV